METTFAPFVTAVFTAVPRSDMLEELASTRRSLQFWQISCAACTSSEISTSQPDGTPEAGSVVPPVWFITWKQAEVTFAVHLGKAGRPNVVSNFVRSAKAVGAL